MNELDFADAIIEEAEIDFEPFYNQHFIEVDEQKQNLLKAGLTLFAPAQKTALLSTKQGGYQFRLFPDGEENPSLYTWDMVPLYKWGR